MLSILGYSSNRRGYRSLDPFSHKVYVSKDLVVFNVKIFPAKEGVRSMSPTPSSVTALTLPTHLLTSASFDSEPIALFPSTSLPPFCNYFNTVLVWFESIVGEPTPFLFIGSFTSSFF
jgi:hypothetical protein